jgi:hypothetical protein
MYLWEDSISTLTPGDLYPSGEMQMYELGKRLLRDWDDSQQARSSSNP